MQRASARSRLERLDSDGAAGAGRHHRAPPAHGCCGDVRWRAGGGINTPAMLSDEAAAARARSTGPARTRRRSGSGAGSDDDICCSRPWLSTLSNARWTALRARPCIRTRLLLLQPTRARAAAGWLSLPRAPARVTGQRRAACAPPRHLARGCGPARFAVGARPRLCSLATRRPALVPGQAGRRLGAVAGGCRRLRARLSHPGAPSRAPVGPIRTAAAASLYGVGGGGRHRLGRLRSGDEAHGTCGS